MNKATKATINRLKKMSKYNRQAEILYNIVIEAEKADAVSMEFPDINDWSIIWPRPIGNTDGGLLVMASQFERPFLRGLSTKYERLIHCSFTHGLNECIIKDINELSRRMLKDWPN